MLPANPLLSTRSWITTLPVPRSANENPLSALREFVRGLKDTLRRDLQDLGLILTESETEIWTYHCTPLNCRTFASSGWDGVHYSFLLRDSLPVWSGPVVMTVPMYLDAENENMVVGGDLLDFLRVGCVFGFHFEEFVYNIEEAAKDYVKDLNLEDHCAVLGKLKERFNLSPPIDIKAHFAALRREYWKHLVVDYDRPQDGKSKS